MRPPPAPLLRRALNRRLADGTENLVLYTHYSCTKKLTDAERHKPVQGMTHKRVDREHLEMSSKDN
ncbi:hypothetical protein MJO28_002117 [Puccinia striiformis f. sp. tritici]|uniref:Uncharacterized protein n=1 Tax=Puccinia striiformis f. sp. tritici TaxID=168172 RepID=A0ACC0EZ01_9BASI|nr:hypothetical protein MJO28_002117 [Puccinia striiformis f. sp. tritici]